MVGIAGQRASPYECLDRPLRRAPSGIGIQHSGLPIIQELIVTIGTEHDDFIFAVNEAPVDIIGCTLVHCPGQGLARREPVDRAIKAQAPRN